MRFRSVATVYRGDAVAATTTGHQAYARHAVVSGHAAACGGVRVRSRLMRVASGKGWWGWEPYCSL